MHVCHLVFELRYCVDNYMLNDDSIKGCQALFNVFMGNDNRKVMIGYRRA